MGPSPWGCREWERLSDKLKGASRLEKQLREMTAHQVASLLAQRVNHLPAMWETGVRSLGQEDPLEKEMATHTSILAWRIPWTEEPGGLLSAAAAKSLQSCLTL